MIEAEQTSNPIRLLNLALDIREALGKALRLRPHDTAVRLDLVRFHVRTPRLAGGNIREARVHAKALATLDAGLGHFAAGYIAYHEKQFGVGRRELREAVRLTTGEHRVLSLRWLGWLSQASQQWSDAFAAWDELRDHDDSAFYEIARTAGFCRCERERGKAALDEYLRRHPADAQALELRKRWPPQTK